MEVSPNVQPLTINHPQSPYVIQNPPKIQGLTINNPQENGPMICDICKKEIPNSPHLQDAYISDSIHRLKAMSHPRAPQIQCCEHCGLEAYREGAVPLHPASTKRLSFRDQHGFDLWNEYKRAGLPMPPESGARGLPIRFPYLPDFIRNADPLPPYKFPKTSKSPRQKALSPITRNNRIVTGEFLPNWRNWTDRYGGSEWIEESVIETQIALSRDAHVSVLRQHVDFNTTETSSGDRGRGGYSQGPVTQSPLTQTYGSMWREAPREELRPLYGNPGYPSSHYDPRMYDVPDDYLRYYEDEYYPRDWTRVRNAAMVMACKFTINFVVEF
jgi:hypothetical protein